MDKQTSLSLIADAMRTDNVTENLRESATNLVPGDGNPDAEIVFIGEAPGAKEDLLGVPFVGAAGKFLATMLASISLSREDIYITNIVKYRPPKNRDPTPAEITASIPYLMRQLDVIEPKIIVLLGRHAMNVFFPELKISEAHGVPVEQDGRTYLPLYHPAAALYNPGLRQALMNDFERIPAIIKQTS